MDRDVPVREVMDREFVGVNESDGLTETVELMLEAETDSVVVLRGAEPVGVMTERDALSALVDEDLENATVDEAMTDAVSTVAPEMTIAEAADEMSAAATKRVLVTDGTEPLGVFTEHDLVSTSPFAPAVGTEAGTVGERTATGRDAGRGQSDVGTGARQDFEDQSICEACGSLSHDLSRFNGQLLCGDCRDI